MAKASDHPFTQRISHWINLITFAVLISTGFIIHAPFQGANMNVARNLHFIFMYILVINGIVRFYVSFFGKNKDYKEFFLNKLDLKTFIPQIKYYLFISKEHPKTNKYNGLQKCAYIALPVLAVFQAITGIILYLPMKFSGAAQALGSLAAVRGIHYVVMWLFIAIILVHVYLVFTEAKDEFFLMFFGKTGKKEKGGANKANQSVIKG
ncbi:Ni/Fe-hydrogenase, b-type cytochrome subunit [Dehalobacter sp. TBBPA1]|uniref:Ni/Fe-hydrogenase, b-type cytochrome subunit n=1 Tax=Dehalobacter sp. TBBPA1 TaxID=3235037 RepID=UPI0034A3B882